MYCLCLESFRNKGGYCTMESMKLKAVTLLLTAASHNRLPHRYCTAESMNVQNGTLYESGRYPPVDTSQAVPFFSPFLSRAQTAGRAFKAYLVCPLQSTQVATHHANNASAIN